MMKWRYPIGWWTFDKLLLFLSWLALGNIEKYSLSRPAVGPMQLKNTKGKTPVLEICALDKIKSGAIKVVLDIKKFLSEQVELVNGEKLDIDSVGGKWLLAIGYHHNVPSWLQARRKVNSSPRIVFQRHRFQMCDKEIVGSMQLGSLGEGSLVHPQIL